MLLGYAVQVEATTSPGGFINFHPGIWSRSRRQWLSRRFYLPFFATHDFLLLPLQPFNFRFYLLRFLATSGPVPFPLSTSPDQESLCPAQDLLGPYTDLPVPYVPSPVPFFRLLRSGYNSSVCWDGIIDNTLLVDWVPVPAGGLVERGNSPAPYSVVLFKPGFLTRSNPPTPTLTFHLVCS